MSTNPLVCRVPRLVDLGKSPPSGTFKDRLTRDSRKVPVAIGTFAVMAGAFMWPGMYGAQAQAAPRARPSASTSAAVVASPGVKTDPPTSLAPQAIENPGFPNAYFYKPRSSKGQKPVIVYLHGRGGIPDEGCRAWAKVVTEFGWLLCPSGQEDRGGGSRGWNNEFFTSTRNVMGSLASLKKKFGKRVQLFGNVLIGFSEGAYVAQNIGPRESKTFNRWLIVASTEHYFGYDKNLLKEAKKNVKRVYLWTGEHDGVVKESELAHDRLRSDGYNVKLNIAKGFFHAIPNETMGQNYRKALKWLLAAK